MLGDMRPLLLTAAIALLLATPVAASAADFKNGDVFVGTSTGEYNVYDNGGTLLETIDQAVAARRRARRSTARSTAAACSTRPPSAPRSSSASSGPRRTPGSRAVTTGASPDSVSFARDGSFYVGHQANPQLAAQVQRRRDADRSRSPRPAPRP